MVKYLQQEMIDQKINHKLNQYQYMLNSSKVDEYDIERLSEFGPSTTVILNILSKIILSSYKTSRFYMIELSI